MLKIFRSGLFIAVILTLAGCSGKPSTEARTACKATGDRFFPLCDFIGEIIANYTAAGYTVDKRVTLNDRTEKLTNLSVDWSTELQPLAAAYINRSAWLNKFQVDTSETEAGFSVKYTSNVSTIPVKEMEVHFTGNNNDVESIRIKTARKNLLYTSNQEIWFEPGKSYRVSGKQRTLFLSKTTFQVESELNMPASANSYREERLNERGKL